jgi:peroxiredoxin
MTRTAALAALLALTAPAAAGEFNKALSVGDAAPAWADLPGTDGGKHSLADMKDRHVVVVVFTCNSCPVAQDYEDRITAFARRYAGPGGKVGLVAVNVNTGAEDRLPKMKERAGEKGFPFPYLYDETQKTARLYGATYTPEFFVLDRDRKVAYMGAMDDKTQPGEAKVNYLADAVEAVLKGQKPGVTETLARGCRIAYQRSRR